MPITPQIDHGAKPGYDAIDETGMLVDELVWTPTRSYTERKDATDQVIWFSGRDPRLEGSLKGPVVPDNNGALVGLAIVHPGTAVAIANFADGDSVHGFAAGASTKVIVKDPTQTRSREDETQLDVPFVFFPGITTYSNATS